ncbi:MAG: PD-(D/E)XK nuclease family protein [Opitutales bacterium]|nr:PD-(D/E)XK nuclease family protein [Opitutales bacterium]
MAYRKGSFGMTGEGMQDSATAVAFEVIGRVFEDYLSLKEESAERVIQRVSGVLDSWLDAKTRLAKENEAFGVDYNPLKSIPIKEPVHSRIIGDFLDPQGRHGQGSGFLQCFLEHLGVPSREEGTWQISIETGRVDILLWRECPASMILIENRVNDAVDQPNQIFRYWYHQMHQWKPKHCLDAETRRSFRLIYLPADESKAPVGHSLERPADWGDEITEHPRVPLPCETFSLRTLMELWREKVMSRVPSTNQRLHVFFHFYNELWDRS